MADRHVLARSMHDIGLAAWFGGSLMGAVGLNGAAASLRDPDERSAAATAGWTRWVPVNAAAIGIHLIGAIRLLQTERGRIAKQDGVARSSAVKTALTAAALGTTAYSGVLNRRMAAAGHVPVQGATEPGPTTPSGVASTQKQLQAVQWLIPGLTGSLIGVTAWQSEQMRPKQVLAGVLPGRGLAGVGAAALLTGLASARRSGRKDTRSIDRDLASARPSRRDLRAERRADQRVVVPASPSDATSAYDAYGATGSIGATAPADPTACRRGTRTARTRRPAPACCGGAGRGATDVPGGDAAPAAGPPGRPPAATAPGPGRPAPRPWPDVRGGTKPRPGPRACSPPE